MATKKKHHKKKPTHRKKKKVSGMETIEAVGLRVLSVTAGAFAGAFAIQAGNTALSNMKPPLWVVPAITAAAGALVPLFDPKNEMLADFGMGILAIGAVFTINETIFSVPGISGLAMSSNSPDARVMQRSVGCTNMKMGAGPGNYMSRTVGKREVMAMGALMSN